MKDDVPEEVKKRRLCELTDLFYSQVALTNKRWIGTTQLVMVKGVRQCGRGLCIIYTKIRRNQHPAIVLVISIMIQSKGVDGFAATEPVFNFSLFK